MPSNNRPYIRAQLMPRYPDTGILSNEKFPKKLHQPFHSKLCCGIFLTSKYIALSKLKLFRKIISSADPEWPPHYNSATFSIDLPFLDCRDHFMENSFLMILSFIWDLDTTDARINTINKLSKSLYTGVVVYEGLLSL